MGDDSEDDDEDLVSDDEDPDLSDDEPMDDDSIYGDGMLDKALSWRGQMYQAQQTAQASMPCCRSSLNVQMSGCSYAACQCRIMKGPAVSCRNNARDALSKDYATVAAVFSCLVPARMLQHATAPAMLLISIMLLITQSWRHCHLCMQAVTSTRLHSGGLIFAASGRMVRPQECGLQMAWLGQCFA